MLERLPIRLASFAIGAIFVGALAVLALTLVRSAGSPTGIALAAGWLLLALGLSLAAARAPRGAAIAAIAVCAVALRLVALIAMGDLESVVTGNDYAAYRALAASIINGDPFVAQTVNYGSVAGMYPPLYPLLLAGAGASLGLAAPTILLLNSLFDAGSAAMLFLLSRRLGEERAGLAAGSLYLIWPGFVIAAPLAQKEGLIILLTLVIAWLFLLVRERGPSWRNSAGLGVATAAMALTQPALVTLPACFVLALLPSAGWRPMLLLALRALPFAAVAMLPWWIRNWLLFSQFVPFTTSMGPSLMVAAANRHVPLGSDLLALAEPARSAVMAHEAAALIASDPLGFASRRALAFGVSLLIEARNASRLLAFAPPVAWAGALLAAMQIGYAGAAGLALRATLAAPRRAGWNFASLLLFAALLQIALVQPWFEFDERHRHFMTPLILLLAALTLTDWLRRRFSGGKEG